MSNNNEALSQPVAWTDAEELAEMNAGTYADMFNGKHIQTDDGQWIALYSQEYVTALIQRAEIAEQKYREEFAKRLIDEVVDAEPRQIMTKDRIREISEGADVIIGENVLLAKTALYYIEKNRDSVGAFQKTGLSLIAQQERNAELERANAAQDDHINQQQDRIDTLEKRNDDIGKYAGKLEDIRQHFLAGYDEGHSRGLSCGRLYKSDDQMRGHRHACANTYVAGGEVEGE